MRPEINVGTVIVEKKPGGATERIFQTSCLHYVAADVPRQV